ncbi:MAG: DUF6290 family protein [Dehalococcoidia bacterium]|nr:DUF6290 family protein [Dehalococcoidia bacterium]
MSTTFTMRIREEDKELINEYAIIHGQSMSSFMLNTALEAIEDDIDLREWRKAKAEFDKNPVTYSAEEIAAKYL